MKYAFIVQGLGWWARGQTVKEAAEGAATMGARLGDFAVVDLILGDDTPEITNSGMNIAMAEDSKVVRVLSKIKMHQLLRQPETETKHDT